MNPHFNLFTGSAQVHRGGKSGIRSATFRLLLVLNFILFWRSFFVTMSLSHARKFIYIVNMKTGYSRFPQAGFLRLDFRYRSNANDGNKLPRTYPVESPPIKKDTQGVFFYWRKLRDSNPCAFWANGFQDRLVMTTSISFRLYKVDLNFLNNFIF